MCEYAHTNEAPHPRGHQPCRIFIGGVIFVEVKGGEWNCGRAGWFLVLANLVLGWIEPSQSVYVSFGWVNTWLFIQQVKGWYQLKTPPCRAAAMPLYMVAIELCAWACGPSSMIFPSGVGPASTLFNASANTLGEMKAQWLHSGLYPAAVKPSWTRPPPRQSN